MRRFILVSLLAVVALAVWSGAEKEAAAAASSSTHGKYLAGQGIIVPSQEVLVHSYVAYLDYQYPDPEGDLGVTLYTGHKQISASGQDEVLHIGIQGRKLAFEELPPMNLAFVIDKSGSMSAQDKMEWVKKAFEIFIEKVRDIDFVSLVVFDNQARVIFPSTQMKSRDQRLRFREAVLAIEPGGGTNLTAGLELGYQQCLANFRTEYANRVLFLTDGVGESAGILEMAERYKELGVNVSTIGVGRDFDLELMNNLALRGGGSSRFISDREEMEETFGSELDRMIVPVARELDMALEFLTDVEILGTWGYENNVQGMRIDYHQDTLHHRDYETILVQFRFPRQEQTGKKELLRFSVSYRDLNDMRHEQGPYSLSVEVVESDHPVSGFSDAMVLRSGTMLHFAQSMKIVGELYYSCKTEIDQVNELRDSLWRERGGAVDYEELGNPEIRRLEQSINSKMQRAMDITVDLKKEILNARLRLDSEGFEDEIEILDNYVEILGQELQLEPQQVLHRAGETEIVPSVQKRPLQEHLANLFREMTLDLAVKPGGVVAVSGFTTRGHEAPELLSLLNEMAVVEIGSLDTLTIVERQKLAALLEEQELALSDLMDTTKAISIGRLMAADYIVTGTVVEMSNSVVIFGRIINVETGEVESVAQVIVPKDSEMKKLLT